MDFYLGILLYLLMAAMVFGVLYLMQRAGVNGNERRWRRGEALRQRLLREMPDHPVARFSAVEMRVHYERAKRAQTFWPGLMVVAGLMVMIFFTLPSFFIPGVGDFMLIVTGMAAAALIGNGARLLLTRRGHEWLLDELARRSRISS